jgi:hypothetical protein
VPILQNVEYPQVGEYLPLPAGSYDLRVAMAGSNCSDVALDLAPVTLEDGAIVSVFAVGLLPDDPNFPLQPASLAAVGTEVAVTPVCYFPIVAAGQ